MALNTSRISSKQAGYSAEHVEINQYKHHRLSFGRSVIPLGNSGSPHEAAIDRNPNLFAKEPQI